MLHDCRLSEDTIFYFGNLVALATWTSDHKTPRNTRSRPLRLSPKLLDHVPNTGLHNGAGDLQLVPFLDLGVDHGCALGGVAAAGQNVAFQEFGLKADSVTMLDRCFAILEESLDLQLEGIVQDGERTESFPSPLEILKSLNVT